MLYHNNSTRKLCYLGVNYYLFYHYFIDYVSMLFREYRRDFFSLLIIALIFYLLWNVYYVCRFKLYKKMQLQVNDT